MARGVQGHEQTHAGVFISPLASKKQNCHDFQLQGREFCRPPERPSSATTSGVDHRSDVLTLCLLFLNPGVAT